MKNMRNYNSNNKIRPFRNKTRMRIWSKKKQFNNNYNNKRK